MASVARPACLAAFATLAGVVVAACQTPTSLTFVYTTDVDCAAVGSPTVAVVVGVAEAIGDVLEPTSTKSCSGTPSDGALLDVGTVVALPGEGTGAVVGMKAILGVTRPTDQCGAVADEDGQPWGGCIVARRRLAFLDGEGLTVDVPLYRDCIGIPCDEDETCVPARGCVDASLSADDCVGGGCGVDDLGTGSSSAATGATATSTGQGGGAGTTTSSATTTATTSTGDGGAGGAGSTSSAGGGGQGGGTAECTGDPDCVDAEPGDCTGYACAGGLCVPVLLDQISCTFNDVPNSGSCNQGQCCSGASCRLSGLGVPCSGDASCESGSCADGRCCDEACTGECRSCRGVDTGLGDGTCGDVLEGKDPHDECVGACGACAAGACGDVAPCTCPAEGAPCEVCVDDLVAYGTCSAGVCAVGAPNPQPPPAPGGPPEPCPGNFICVSPQGCLTQCLSDDQCLGNATCNQQGNCVAP